MLSVAFVPHPPVLVPELGGGPLTELSRVRQACAAAVSRLLATGPDVVWVVGDGPLERWYGAGDVGSLASFGRAVTVQMAGPAGPDGAVLPLSLTVGAWLLDQAGYAGERLALSVPGTAQDRQLRELAAEFVGRGALLVVGDGSAVRNAEAPGPALHAAVRFDDDVAAALAAGDAAVLSTLDPLLGLQLQAQGVGPWRLAGHCLRDVRVSADLLYYGAPFGVAYCVATWLPV
ncbi:MAG: hypothetical protein H0V67_01815 [Geodermatophilaceae bacterium]|nr:hypothetical protein [Geodermatophilaceae bacterium]